MQELFDLIESHNRKAKLETEKIEQEVKVKATLNFVLAQQIGEQVASLFSKGVKLTPLEKFFPELFKTEEELKRENELELYKAKMRDYMIRHNLKIKRKEG